MEPVLQFKNDDELEKYLVDDVFPKRNHFTERIIALFATFHRSRQLPRLLMCLKKTLGRLSRVKPKLTDPLLTTEVIQRFAVICHELPPVQLREAWTTLVSGFSEELLPSLLERITKKHNTLLLVNMWSELFATFLLHNRILHHSTLVNSASYAEELMTLTATKCVRPLLLFYTENDKSLGTSAVRLCLAWGELSLLLQRYWPRVSLKRGHHSTSALDLSYVHPYLTLQEWKEYTVACQNLPEDSVTHLNVLLLLQKIRAIEQFEEDVLKNKALLKTAEVVGKIVLQLDLENHELQISVWTAVLSRITLVVPYWPIPTTLDIVRRLVGFLCNSFSQPLHTLALTSMNSASVSETKTIQTLFVCATLEQIFNIPGFHTRLEASEILTVLIKNDPEVLLSEMDSDPTQKGPTNTTWSAAEQAGTLLDKLLSHSDADARRKKSVDQQLLLSCLKSLECVPLQSLLPGNQVRVLLGVVAVLQSVCDGVIDAQETLPVIKCCRKIVVTILEGSRSVWLLNFVHGSHLLSWMMDAEMKIAKLGDVSATSLKSFATCLTSVLKLAINNRVDLLTFVENVTDLKNKFDDLTPHQWNVAVVTCSVTARCLCQVFKRSSYKYGALRIPCQQYLSDLCTVIIAMMERVGKGSSFSPSATACLFEVYISMLELSESKEIDLSLNWTKYIDKAIHSAVYFLDNDTADEMGFQSSIEILRGALKHRSQCETLESEDLVYSLWCSTIRNHTNLYWEEKTKSCTATVCNGDKRQHIVQSQNFDTFVNKNSSLLAVEDLVQSFYQCSSLPELERFLGNLTHRLAVEEVDGQSMELLSSIRLLSFISGENLPEDKLILISDCFTHVMSVLPSVLSRCPKEERAIKLVVLPLLEMISGMLSLGKHLNCDSTLSLCFHVCVEVLQLSNIYSLVTFERLVAGVYNVLNALLIHHQGAIMNMIPSFLAAVTYLLQVILLRSDQGRASQDELELLVSSAQYLNRLLDLINRKLNKDFDRVAPYLVAEFISVVQQITIFPAVKEALVSGIYSILQLCDHHSIALLQSNLPHSNRELFKELFQSYQKERKFKRKRV